MMLGNGEAVMLEGATSPACGEGEAVEGGTAMPASRAPPQRTAQPLRAHRPRPRWRR